MVTSVITRLGTYFADSPMVIASECLKLNDTEKQIFTLLKEFLRDQELPLTLRVAGGWVRDKLLGQESHDCDIAIDKMMGQPFAEQLRSYLIHRQVAISAYGVIQANPDRSKHLETATLTIFGYPVDFVNLRSEKYTAHSRIPIIQLGSPLEDALRRDLTINALFYNINEDIVEDYCGTGFADLEAHLVRTPLPPKETLLDDPLRVLRVIRFASKLQFSIDTQLREAMSDIEVRKALHDKISRERVGIEVEKILHDKNCLMGLHLMSELRMFRLVFDPQPDDPYAEKRMHYCDDEKILRLLSLLKTVLEDRILSCSYNKWVALLTISTLPWLGLTRAKKAGEEAIVEVIIRDSLKLRNQDYKNVMQLHNQIPSLLDAVNSNSFEPVVFGRLVRAMGSHWRIGFDAAYVFAILEQINSQNHEDTRKQFISFEQKVIDFELDEAWSWKPVLSGGDIQSVLGIPAGRYVGELMQRIMDWQFTNPKASRKEAITHLLTLGS